MATELAQLGWPSPRQSTGLVTCTGGSEELFRACLGSRCATDLRVRVGRFQASSLEGLAQGLGRLPWTHFVHPGQPVEIAVSSRGSRMRRRDATARKAQLAIRDAVRGPRVAHRPGARDPRRLPPVKVMIRIEQSRAQASVDPVGSPLWKRGYRSRGGAAPLRENLAAASLMAMDWSPSEPLLDPFCGSGTLLIEAAGIGLGRAPGAARGFSLEHWPCHATKLWRKLRGEVRSHRGGPRLELLGSDADPAVLEIARRNASAAGVDARIRWLHQRVDGITPPERSGLVIGNPPWGQRLGVQVRGVYTALGRTLRERFAGWRIGLLCPDRALIKAVGIPMQPRLDFPHGGARLTLWAGRVPQNGSTHSP